MSKPKKKIIEKPLRVLYLANSAQIGGASRSLLTVACGIKKSNMDPIVIVPSEGPMVDACKAQKLETIVRSYQQPSWREPLKTLRVFIWWRQLLQSLKIDIVHANDISNARSIAFACAISKIPLICHIRFPIALDLAKWAFKRVPSPDCYVFVSQSMQTSEGPKLRITSPHSHQIFIHNAVDLSEFQPKEYENVGYPLIGIVANLAPVKGHKDFLKMAAELTARSINAQYWIIGKDVQESGYDNELKKYAAFLKIERHVKFLGHCDNVSELINQLDIVVCASLVEPFGRCLIEAMACSKPVIATRVGGIPESVIDGVTGLLVPPSSPVELADAVQLLLSDPKLRESMGKAGYERAHNSFSQKKHIEDTITLYKKYLQNY